MSRNKFKYNGVDYDSNEQIQFVHWLEQLIDYQIVQSYVYQPQSFKLSQKQQYNGKFILHPHIYTADFLIKFNPQNFEQIKQLSKYFKFNIDDTYQFYVDVKGGYNIHDSWSMLSINNKWVWMMYRKYIYKVQIDKLFKKTFIPHKCRFTKVREQLIKKYSQCKILEQLILSNPKI